MGVRVPGDQCVCGAQSTNKTERFQPSKKDLSRILNSTRIRQPIGENSTNHLHGFLSHDEIGSWRRCQARLYGLNKAVVPLGLQASAGVTV